MQWVFIFVFFFSSGNRIFSRSTNNEVKEKMIREYGAKMIKVMEKFCNKQWNKIHRQKNQTKQRAVGIRANEGVENSLKQHSIKIHASDTLFFLSY